MTTPVLDHQLQWGEAPFNDTVTRFTFDGHDWLLTDTGEIFDIGDPEYPVGQVEYSPCGEYIGASTVDGLHISWTHINDLPIDRGAAELMVARAVAAAVVG